MENVEVTPENVELAVQQFYKDLQSQKHVHYWLTLAQHSSEAWRFSWQLLHPSKAVEVQFYAASTLHVKISRFWHELPHSQRQPLRQKLLECILSYADGPKVVCIRLHVALAAFVLHSVPEEWSDPIGDIISALQPHNLPSLSPDRVMLILTEILTVIPEEFQTAQIIQARRGLVRQEIQKRASKVMKIVLSLLDHPNPPLQALRCVSAWVQLGVPVLDVDFQPLIDRLVSCVQQPDLYESALEALSTLMTHPDIHRYPNHVMKFLEKILQVEVLLQKGVGQGDMELCSSIYGMLVSVGEVHSRLLLDRAGKNEGIDRAIVMKMMQLVLQCNATPGQYPTDETCSEQAFGFWYIIQDDVIASDDLVEMYINLFEPVYRALVDVLLTKSQYPPGMSEWSSDEKELFRCYRQDIADTLMYSYNVLRNNLLIMLHQRIRDSVEKCRQNPSYWPALEACLHAFCAIAEVIDTSENFHMPQFLQLLTTIPYNNNVAVVGGAITAIGAYARWLCVHPESLGTVMPLLIYGLTKYEVASPTTHALKSLTRDCQCALRPWAPQILQATQEVFRSGSLKAKDSIRLMLSVGSVLSTLPSDSIMGYLTALLEPIIKEMNAYGAQQPTPENKTELVLRLKILGALFTTLDTRLQEEDEEEGQTKEQESQIEDRDPQPVLIILQEVFVPMQTIVYHWINDPDIIESVCEVLKQATGTLMDDCVPLIGDILNLLMHMYQSHPQPPAINLAKQLMIMFGGNKSQAEVMNLLLSHICMTTVSVCSVNPRENTHILEAFLSALAMLVRKFPELFLKGLDLSALFQCGIVALALPEAPTVKSASQFLTHFIMQSRESQLMLSVIQQHGETLVLALMRAIRGDSPRALMEAMVGVTLALNKKYPDHLSRWLQSVINIQAFFPPRVTQEQKQHFVSAVLRERANKRKLNEEVKEFTLICRGIIGTEYAANTSSFL